MVCTRPMRSIKWRTITPGSRPLPISSNNTGNDALAGSVTAPEPGALAGGALHIGTASTQSESVVRSAGVVSIAVLMSRVTGLVRESAMARLFGAGLICDAFQL